jgi:uncharacterized protein (UPF0332 family)
MLHVADALLRGEGVRRNSQRGIIAAFGEYFAKPGRVPSQFHRHLIDAKDVREAADYDMRPEVSLSDARERLAQAVEFLELARRQLGDLPA